MKYLFFTLFVLLFFGGLQASAQKHEIRIGGELSHPVHDINISDLPGYQYHGIKGIEPAYFYALNNEWQIGLSGFYQWNTYYVKIDEKYDCNEGGVGLLVKNTFYRTKSERFKLLWTFASYNGVVGDEELLVNRGSEWIPTTPADDVEGDKFFSDLYIDMELNTALNKIGNISFALFIKYRIIDNWVNENFDGFQFGMKLAYSYGF